MRSTTYSLTFVAECALSNVWSGDPDLSDAVWWADYAARHFGRKAGAFVHRLVLDRAKMAQSRDRFRTFVYGEDVHKALATARRERGLTTA